MNEVRLENWSIVSLNVNPYTAPELVTFHLQGVSYGHPKCPNGYMITSTAIIGKVEDIVITKSGRHYKLGKVDSIYEKLYPDALNRVMKSLSDRR